jgi:hypothetical protein
VTPAFDQLAERLRAIHGPMEQEVEHWFDPVKGRSPSCSLKCDDRTCEGHTATIEVCRECGHGHDGETPVFRAWPCPTLDALSAAEAQRRIDDLVVLLAERYAES